MTARAFALALLGAGPALAAQTLGVGTGLHGAGVRDDLLIPLTFSGPGFDLRLLYRAEVGPALLAVNVRAGAVGLWDRFDGEGHGTNASVDAACLLPIQRSALQRLAVGPVAAWDSSMYLLESWDDAHGYWLGAAWLGVGAHQVVALGTDWRLEITPALGLIGLAGRPPAYRYDKQDPTEHADYYLLRPTEDARFVTLADLQAIRLDLTLRAAGLDAPDVLPGWSFGLDARATRIDTPAPMLQLEGGVHVTRSWGG